MKEFHISPRQWKQTTKTDKKILQYYRIMENHYMELSFDKPKRDIEKENDKQKLLASLPKQQRRR